MDINQDVVSGKWKQIKGRIKQLRGELTHNRLARITGEFEQQVGRLQERYGVAGAQAKRAVKKLVNRPKS